MSQYCALKSDKFMLCNKHGSRTTPSHKSGSVTASENMAERPCKSITLEEKVKVNRRMEHEHPCPAVCRI
jgi:hypothetical protein